MGAPFAGEARRKPGIGAPSYYIPVVEEFMLVKNPREAPARRIESLFERPRQIAARVEGAADGL